MSGSLNRCRVAIAKLREVLAQQEILPFALEQTVQEAGFENIAEAKKYADQYSSLRAKHYKMSGNLANNPRLWASIAEQLPTGQVRFPYSAKKTLGRMRAMVRLVGLDKGYVPLFQKVKDEDRFYTDYMHPVERDIYNTMYTVPVKPMNEKAQAFLKLPSGIKEQLRNVSIDEAQ